MRKNYFMAIMAAVMIVVFANFAFATCSGSSCGGDQNVDISISNKVDTTVNATGGNATQNQDQAQKQLQDQKQTQKAVSNSGGNTYEDAKNFVTASPLQNFVTPVTPSTPLGWKQLGCDFIVAEFSIGQLRKMAEGASFMKKRGTFWYSVFANDVEYSIFAGKETNLNDSAVVRIMVKAPARVNGNAYLGEAEGVGRYGAPMGQIIGATVLGLVQRTGASQVVIYWDYLIEGVAMSNTLGIGVVGSATERNAGSVAVGAAGSTTYNLTSIAYRIKAQAFMGMGGEFFSCEAPIIVVPPPPPVVEPQVKACDPEKFRKELRTAEDGYKHCPKPCLNNQKHRGAAADAYARLYECTGKTDRDLLYKAIKNYEIAERDFLNGREPDGTRTRNIASAQKLMRDIYYNWSWSILVLYGEDAQTNFAKAKGLTVVPQAISELK